MTRLTLDQELRAKLGGLHDLVELCDEDGHVVGFFHPAAPTSDSHKQPPVSPISDKDIEAARQQRTGRALKDIFADLDQAASDRRS